MKVRGERECQACGARWSYFETGEVACPDCGSLRSVAVDEERERHTDSPAELDLGPVRAALGDDADWTDVADDVDEACREYCRRRGFIHAGDLRPLDDTFLAAHELRTAVADYTRAQRAGVDLAGDPDDAERYLLALLNGADDGDRPEPGEVPESMTAARGLAYARALEDYRDEVATYVDDDPDPDGRRVLGRLRDRVKRVAALDGDVDPAEVETLVRVARDLQDYLANGDEAALATATDRLESLADD